MSQGLVLNDRYRLLERLAIGGMGEVWRGTDQVLAREVAVKLLRQALMTDASALSRFRAEARFAAALQHGGIAQVYDFGEQDGRAYLVMELVPGEPLSRILARTGGLPAERTLELVAETARALAAAHAAGIVHRDIKPANLMVTGDGTVKITDFGIARALKGPSLTQTGMVMGTAHYISPEQASGQEITPAADLYSLGVVAFECLAGQPPFDADNPVGVALKHVREAPPEPPGRPPAAVRALIAELLAKAPGERPGSATEVAERAERIRRSLGAAAPGPGPMPVLSEFDADAAPDTLTSREVTGQRRTALMYTSVAAGVLLLGGVAAGSLWRGASTADLVRDQHQRPAVRTGGDQPERPAAPATRGTVNSGPGSTSRSGAPAHLSTPGTPGASPSSKPTRKPTRATPTAPEPTTPAPTVSTTTPSTPSPAPSPTRSGGLGSEDKV